MNYTIDEQGIIDRTKKKMKSLGYNVDTVADKIYLGRSTVYRMLDGRSEWTDERIRLMANALLVTETYLRTGCEEVTLEAEVDATYVSRTFNTFRDYLYKLEGEEFKDELSRCGKELLDIIIEVAYNSKN